MSIRHKINQLSYYAYLVNPVVPKRYRICRSFSREAHRYYDFLEESQWWSADKLKEYQDEKLRNLIRHAYSNVPYYREVFDRHGIKPQDIRSSEDLVRIPILTKDIIRKNFPEKIVAETEKVNTDAIWTTGGSTGMPLKFYGDIRSNNIAWAAFFRFLRWTGYEWGDSIVVFWREQAKSGNIYKLHHRFLDWLQKSKIPNVTYFNSSTMGEEQLSQYVSRLSSLRPKILRGYVSALKYLANYYSGQCIKCIKPKAITTTAEVLNPNDRELLKQQFEADVFDQYGSAECMGVAFECNEHSGLHSTIEHCVVEFVDEKGNRVEDGIRGKMLITDLDNYTMPFIRYMNGDEGRYRVQGCSCGRGLPLIDYVEGRTVDMITGVNGNSAHGLFFVTVLQELNWFEKYGVMDFEIVQKNPDQIDCRFVCKVQPDNTSKSDFVEFCCRHFGRMGINISFVDQIPTGPARKKRYTRSEIAG